VPLYDTLGEAAVLHALNHSDVRPRPLPQQRQWPRPCCCSRERGGAVHAGRRTLCDDDEAGEQVSAINMLEVVKRPQRRPREPVGGCAGSCHERRFPAERSGRVACLRHEVPSQHSAPAARPLTPRRGPGLGDFCVHREAVGAGQAAGGAARARAHGRRLGPGRRGGGLRARPCAAARPCQRLPLTLRPSCQAPRP